MLYFIGFFGSAAVVLGVLHMDMRMPKLWEIMLFGSIKEAWGKFLKKVENRKLWRYKGGI